MLLIGHAQNFVFETLEFIIIAAAFDTLQLWQKKLWQKRLWYICKINLVGLLVAISSGLYPHFGAPFFGLRLPKRTVARKSCSRGTKYGDRAFRGRDLMDLLFIDVVYINCWRHLWATPYWLLDWPFAPPCFSVIDKYRRGIHVLFCQQHIYCRHCKLCKGLSEPFMYTTIHFLFVVCIVAIKTSISTNL